MAYSYVRYSGNGSTTNYTFSFPVISTDHIKVRVNGTLVTNWSFLSASTIQFAAAPANAAVIEIRRETPKESSIVNFTDGSVLLERDLDLLATWQLYVAQETEDDLEDTIRVDSQGLFDAQNKRIINVADPVNAQDAVTKNWAETAMSSQLAQATSQATAAAASATAAAGSAASAATSASTATTQATSATASATSATGSATAAAGSATAAANSATAAGTSATNANSSAIAAASSATAAAGSVTAATTQATNAATSAVSAANSAAAAATALDNFDDRYLGQKATDPALDNDGNALITGALYYNTTDSAMRVYTGTGWINASSAQVATMKTYVYVATAAQTTFSGNDVNGSSLTYVAPYLIVSLNGLELRPVVDYTATSGLSVVLTAAATSGDELQIQAFSGFNVANIQSANVSFQQAGTGATVRTADEKLKESVSVRDFGASPSNSAAVNASCVQSAINSLTAGGEVVFPNGDWPMDTVYVQNDRVSIRGEGDATIIIPGNSDGIVVGLSATRLSFCDVRDLRFDRAVKSASGAAVKMVNTVYSAVENCKFKNSYIGVHVKTHNDSLRVERNTFYDGTYYGVYEYNQNETWANDLTIRGNFFWHVEQAGVYMAADGVGVASVGDSYIEDNVFVSSISKGALQTQYAVRVVGAGTYNTNITVSRNTFEGIRLQTVFMTGLNRCRIADNYFSGTDTNDVGLYFGSGVGNSIISGNVFVGYNNPGAFVFSTNAITLTGNHFTSNATLGGANAELKMLNVQDVQVSGNYFYSSSSRYCIDIEQSGAAVDNLTITGNRFAKFSSNANYVYDIRHNNYGGAKLMRGNIGNDATSGAATAAPVAGMALQWYAGDKIENKTASELGTAGSKYVVIGWVCTAQGDPGTWREQRVLTGL